jgi:hypothetical protein
MAVLIVMVNSVPMFELTANAKCVFMHVGVKAHT